MLPGFRFLFAATMLSMSLLIFGLGAAALFRAAHESFASTSSWHAPPDVAFAQRPDTTLPMLAALRVEPVTAKPADPPKLSAAPAAPAAAITDQVTALPPEETPPAEITRPVETPTSAPVAENPPVPEAAPARTEAATAGETKTAATTNETRIAAVAALDAPSLKSEPAAPVTSNSPAAPPTASVESTTSATASAAATKVAAPASEAENAAAKIAVLGGPPVEVSDSDSVLEPGSVKIPRARPDESAIKKRQQARRAARRRWLATRARLLAQQQLQANPFTQPPFVQPPFAQQPLAPPQQSFAAASRRQ